MLYIYIKGKSWIINFFLQNKNVEKFYHHGIWKFIQILLELQFFRFTLSFLTIILYLSIWKFFTNKEYRPDDLNKAYDCFRPFWKLINTTSLGLNWKIPNLEAVEDWTSNLPIWIFKMEPNLPRLNLEHIIFFLEITLLPKFCFHILRWAFSFSKQRSGNILFL